MSSGKKRVALPSAPQSVSPCTASALEWKMWQAALEEAGYWAVALRTRMSYTARGTVQLWYLVSDAPMSVMAAMLLKATPSARTEEREVERPPIVEKSEGGA